MNRLEFYERQLKDLRPKEREKFEYLFILAENYSAVRLGELSEQYDLRRNFTPKGDREEFTERELSKTIDRLTSVSLRCDWRSLNNELSTIREEVRTAVKGKQYYWIDHDEELNILFMFVASFSDLLSEYLDREDYVLIPADYNISTLRDFDKIIELLGQFRWAIMLVNVIENKDYSGSEMEIMYRTPSELFKKKADFEKIFSVLGIKEYYTVLSDGSYRWAERKKIYLAYLAQKLRNKDKLIDALKTNQDLARAFCPCFNVKFNAVHEKQFETDRAEQVPPEYRGLIDRTIKED